LGTFRKRSDEASEAHDEPKGGGYRDERGRSRVSLRHEKEKKHGGTGLGEVPMIWEAGTEE